MKIKEIGGEFELIKRIIPENINDPQIIKGIGDDCAVIKYSDEKHLLITTDMMVEKDHFNINWSTPFQIGMKLMEVNVSDIVSMGGIPKYAFLSISLLSDTTVEFLDEFYKGLYHSAQQHQVYLLGGDTTHGTEYVFNLTIIGEVKKSMLRLRSMAQVGDQICVTGKLGGSTAGLKLLLNQKRGYLLDHLEPKSRMAKEGMCIATHAHAMIDVSDGLASEITHICTESHVGAQIMMDSIPLSKNTIESAKIVSMNPYDFALYGGEDFEIVFTIKKENIKELRKYFSDFTIVGEILQKDQDIYLLKDNKKLPLKKGFDHFT